MTKYRIVQKGNWFYPQYKKFLFWFNFKVHKLCQNTWTGDLEYRLFPDCKLTYERALSVIEKDKESEIDTMESTCFVKHKVFEDL